MTQANEHSLGAVVRSYRKARGLKQQTLADRIGTQPSYISELEHDKRPNITIEVLEKLAGALNVPLATLVQAAWGDSVPPVENAGLDGLPDQEFERLAALWPDIPKRLRPMVLRLGRELTRLETVADEAEHRARGKKRPAEQ
jgi:transcriptional regulator with XRE-family HTH domain